MIRALLLVPVVAVPLVQVRIDRALGAERRRQDVLYLWSGEHVRRLAPGFENVMADLYWLRTVQYFGGQRVFAADKNFDLLEPLIDITVTLDPRFEIAYRYGAIFLAEPWPTGAGKPQRAIALLERGSRALPDSWRLRQELGLFHYSFLNDATTAARILMEAARMPGAPYWLETLAADILNKAGDRETSRKVWQRLYDQAEEGALRNNAYVHLQRLDALDAIDRLNELVKVFQARTGRLPADPRELRTAGLFRGEFVDPTGVTFSYDLATGQFAIARDSVLWRP